MGNKWLISAAFVACVALLVASVLRADGGDASDGKAVFLANKCETCHAVLAAGIAAKIDPTKTHAPALPLAEAPADEWLVKFLRQEVPKGDKKHVKKFAGTDEELNALLSWLGGLAEGS